MRQRASSLRQRGAGGLCGPAVPGDIENRILTADGFHRDKSGTDVPLLMQH